MLKKFLLALAALIVTAGFAYAQVDVNKADQAALDGIKGVGPKISLSILEERKRGGEFKDWSDFESRVKGVGERNAVKLSEAGLTINGQTRPKTSANGIKEDKKIKVAKKDEPKK